LGTLPVRLRRDSFLGLLGGRPDVVRPVDAIQFDDFIGELARTACRFFREDIEPGSNTALRYCPRQRILIHHLRARSIDEVGARFHRREELRVHHPLRLLVERHVHADDVGRFRHFNGR
jgi:hypothetical protein